MARKNKSPVKQRPHPRKVVSLTASHHSGPIPSPEALEKYEAICPGLADRIVSMAERQGAHRQQLESRVIRAGIRRSYLGVLCGVIIGIVALSLGAWTAVKGHPIVGFSFGGSGVGGLVWVFIYGTRSNRIERERKELL